MRLNELLIIVYVILFFTGCPMGIRISRSVSGVENTYIKFKISKMNGFKIVREYINTDVFLFHSRIKKDGIFANIQFTIFDNLYMNPSENYYYRKQDGLYRNIFFQISGNMREDFLIDCEYRMPTPAGSNKYSFDVDFQAYQRSGSLESEFDLPPNHSIRLNFVPKDIEVPFVPFSEEAFKDPKDRKVILKKKKIFEIIATVEPNPEPDEDKPCEIPKD
ncbi:hypothetical protein [Leptospira interrogans]|uniref:hypothetical protein n=1 Tax=Leptospira interrogans TaxID=173 RepID=UPI000AFB6333|nr:hypothetical protein [Leptospira interrogans]ULG94523.1 hypothetical protein FH584_19790 [Leptospira interrogans]ULG94552.1 hypothetical protein FH584_19495 [Leptospira interrogans]